MPAEEPEPSFLDMAESFFSEMWQPTVAQPAPGVRSWLFSRHAAASLRRSRQGQPTATARLCRWRLLISPVRHRHRAPR